MKLLQHIRVLDLGRFITAPLAGQLLGELGADVVKVESRDAIDPFRAFEGGLYGPHFQSHNRNKRSLALAFATPEGQAALRRLIAGADVVLLNMRPGAEHKLGLDYESLRALNPGLVYCSITGFGASGPYAHRPAFDNVGQALSGWLSMFHQGGDPRVPGPPVSDSLTGLYAAMGVLAALLERARSGQGRKVEVSMLESLIAFSTEPLGQLSAKGARPAHYSRASLSQSYILTCADGLRIGLHLSSPEKFWRSLVAAIERPDLLARFPDRASRVDGYEALARELAAVFAQRERADWMRVLEAHDVPAAPERLLDELAGDAQVRHLGVFQEMRHPLHGPVTAANRAIRFDGDNHSAFAPPPAFGEHTLEVLAQAGFGAEEIERLRACGAIDATEHGARA
ncbi:CaiB/BaiF CoA transferase family protein [Bordetella bronchiseptica]|uniref:CaiB/BaiF CoA transferase family protein n=1 Tax=Bordetella bronchiseptica TaxID=518 RepID=UPI00081CDA5A|nr:CaiB/BaiF CoA-transferase family protein [Bordetella bronchiseptica]AOB26841.1 formyl-CoA transferase [Bordetella bronchiseptica]AZW44153.1 CoA transferase [Bordetella bronchiseptica]MBN3269573.1 CoA transferase [Bordetella bronchiseptica]